VVRQELMLATREKERLNKEQTQLSLRTS
jgi:hypothetical protein